MNKNIPKSMEELLVKVKDKLGDDTKLYTMFENCFTNTLNKTVSRLEDGTTYVITGDIPAMWLRDSVCQLRPYLILAAQDDEIADTIEGLVKRLYACILSDPYANAFNETDNGNCWEKDETEMKDNIWERKYEIDSLCFPIQLSYLLWKNTGRVSHFDDQFVETVKTILNLFKTEQNHEENSPYNFVRKNCYYTDTLSRNGKGALVKSDIGMTWSGFRPSDDACMYGYLIPSNMFATVVLGYVEEIASNILRRDDLAKEAKALAIEIKESIEKYGVIHHADYGNIYAYEVDGYGQFNIMDDANVPSLLAAPYLGYTTMANETYANTRKVILSEANPYYYAGKCAQGIGSPHTPVRYIWHISLAMEGLTSDDPKFKKEMIDLISSNDGGTNLMHEGFHVDDSTKYTREWFSWANAVFSELVLDYCGFQVKS